MNQAVFLAVDTLKDQNKTHILQLPCHSMHDDIYATTNQSLAPKLNLSEMSFLAPSVLFVPNHTFVLQGMHMSRMCMHVHIIAYRDLPNGQIPTSSHDCSLIACDSPLPTFSAFLLSLSLSLFLFIFFCSRIMSGPFI